MPTRGKFLSISLCLSLSNATIILCWRRVKTCCEKKREWIPYIGGYNFCVLIVRASFAYRQHFIYFFICRAQQFINIKWKQFSGKTSFTLTISSKYVFSIFHSCFALRIGKCTKYTVHIFSTLQFESTCKIHPQISYTISNTHSADSCSCSFATIQLPTFCAFCVVWLISSPAG